MAKTITLTEEEFTDKNAEIFSDLSEGEKFMMKLAFGKMNDLEMAVKKGVIVTILSGRLFKGEE